MEELLLQLAESLRKSMVLASAEVWTGADGRYELATGVPHRDAPPLVVGPKELPVVARAGVGGGTWIDIWLPGLKGTGGGGPMRVAPIAHAGDLLGLIIVARRPGAESFTERDDTVLTELARQVGLALHNVQLDMALQASLEELQQKNAELLQSRARIVAAGDAARRKLERNLHDGAQQRLVALAVKIRLARDSVEDDPDDAIGLLDELKTDLQETIQEVRALAHGIFPPLLVSGGLPEALRAAGARSPMPTTVDVTTTRRYHQDVEAAVYFCCLEAMQNSAKHGGEGASIDVRVWEEPSLLCFEVADDGAGFDRAGMGVDGHGFVNMADRIGAIEGTLSVASTPGTGTKVGGRIPLSALTEPASSN
jgi:signal transduction histidine kinase